MKSNHVVCLDGYRRLVWDSEEEYPVELNPDSLRLCTAVASKKVIVNVREVVKQREKMTKKAIELVELD